MVCPSVKRNTRKQEGKGHFPYAPNVIEGILRAIHKELNSNGRALMSRMGLKIS